MPTLNINGNIRTDTEANWTSDVTVYSAKTLLVSTDVQYTGTDQNKFKLANGTDTWSNLDYMPIADGDLLSTNNLSDVANAATSLSNIGGIGAATTDTLTNKTFDANGTGNSLSNVDVADLSNGTDGELITWDAAGAPATVAVGTSGQVLTSNGVGAAPTFQDASGGQTYSLVWNMNSTNPADSTTYFLPCAHNLTASTSTNGNRRHKVPVACSSFTLNIGIAANGSTEGVTWTVRNHTQSTEANFDTTHSWTSGGQANAWNGTATLSCNADDYIEIKFTAPVWTTNPTGVRIVAILTFMAD